MLMASKISSSTSKVPMVLMPLDIKEEATQIKTIGLFHISETWWLAFFRHKGNASQSRSEREI